MIAFRPEQGSGRLLSAIEYLEQDGAEKIALGPLDETGVSQVAVDALGDSPMTPFAR